MPPRNLIVLASLVVPVGTVRADTTTERAADGLRLQLVAGGGLSFDEPVPMLLLVASYRYRWVSVEAGLCSFFVRTDATAGLRVFPLPARGEGLSVGARASLMFTSIDNEISDDPTVMVSAGYERPFGRRWLFSAEIGSWWILEYTPDQAFVALLGIGGKIY
jgi:hypothetical protein